MDTIAIRNPEKWKVAKLPDFIMDNTYVSHHQTIKMNPLN